MVTLVQRARHAVLIAAIAVGALAVLALAAAAVVPLLVPAGELRRAAEAAIAATTGRPAVITGEPTLRILPSPRLVLGKVTFALPEGHALDADGVITRLDLWPLLTGHAEIADVTLIRPTLILTRGAAGQPADPAPSGNGRTFAPISAWFGEAGPARRAVALLPLLARADLPELRIIGGTIALRAQSGLTEELIGGIMGTLDRVQDGRGVVLDLALQWRDVPVSATLAVDDAKAFLSGTLAPARLNVSSDGAFLRYRGRAALGPSPSAEGEVTVESRSLRSFITWLGYEAPTSGGFGPLSATARVGTDEGALSLFDARVELDGNRSEGALRVAFSGSRPLLQGTFAADDFSLDPYGRPRLMTRDGRRWDTDTIRLGWLNTVDLDLRLSAAQVTADKSVFTTVATSAVLSSGRLVLALGQANGWGGTLRAAATLTPRAEGDHSGATVLFDADFTDIALDKALSDIAGLRWLEGTGNLQMELKGEGRSILDIAQSLSGDLTLKGDGGYLLGFDVPQALQRIERRPLAGGVDARGGRTPYTKLFTRIAVRKGVAEIGTLEVLGRQVRISLAGAAAIGPRELDLSGRAVLLGPATAAATTAKTATGQDASATTGSTSAPPQEERVDLPFTIRGSWDNPSILADPQSLLERSGAAQPLMDAVRHRTGVDLRPLAAPATDRPAANGAN